jgi:hypothetical protein
MREDKRRQHKSYRLSIHVIEEVDVYKNREDSHGGPGYYPDEVLLAHANTSITEASLANVIGKVTRGEHDLNAACRGR